jgi:uncharacterized protein GlcG (DUF336 family)
VTTTYFEKASIGYETAQRLIRRAEQEAAAIGVPSVIAVVDESGVLKLVGRMDGAPLSSVQVAQDKAYSAAATATPTDAWHDIARQVPELGIGLYSIDRLCPIGGGLPIRVGEHIIGAIGVSGGSVEQDIQVATAALKELDV